MPTHRFDALCRMLAAPASRRRGLRLLAGALAALAAAPATSARAQSGCAPDCDCDHVQAGILSASYRRQCRQTEAKLKARYADGAFKLSIGPEGTIIGGDVCDDVASGPNAWPLLDRPGNCVGGCPEGLTACGRGCFQIDTNRGHCGGCDTACGGNEHCVSGHCRPRLRGGDSPGEGEPVEIGYDATPTEGDAEETGFRGGPNLPGVVAAEGPAGAPGVRWQQALGDQSYAAPVAAAGVLYAAGGDGALRALDSTTGEERWRFQTGDLITGAPAVAGGLVVVGSFDGTIYARRATDGAAAWSVATGARVAATPTVAAGVAYVGGLDGAVRAIGLADGAVRWVFQADHEVIAAAAVASGLVVVASVDGDTGSREAGFVGSCFALDAATGDVRWLVRRGAFAAPAIVNGVVHLHDMNGILRAFALDTGDERWATPINGEPDGPLPDEPDAAPACDGDTVYAGGVDGALIALAASDGSLRWSVATGGPILSSPLVANGVVYVGGGDGNLLALDAATGDVRWRVATGFVATSPAVADGWVYVTALDGTLTALAG